jgi:hypothetical protein
VEAVEGVVPVDDVVKRWVAYGGLVFVLLVVVATVVTPGPPSTNATAAKVMSYYHQHQGAYYVGAYVIVAAVIVGLAYFWYLREWLARVPESRRLLTVAYAGAIVFAVSGTVGAGLNFALAQGSHASNITGATMQTLNLLKNDLNIPIAAAGTAAFLIVTGVVVLRNGGLPRWLGWFAVVFAAISGTGVVGPVPVGLWVLLTSIWMLVRGRSEMAGANATPDTQPV